MRRIEILNRPKMPTDVPEGSILVPTIVHISPGEGIDYKEVQWVVQAARHNPDKLFGIYLGDDQLAVVQGDM